MIERKVNGQDFTKTGFYEPGPDTTFILVILTSTDSPDIISEKNHRLSYTLATILPNLFVFSVH